MGNDISNLLSKFGATVDGYLEVEAVIDYKEPVRKPVVPLVPAKAEAAEPAMEVAPAAAEAQPAAQLVPAALPVQPASPLQRIEPVIEPLVEASVGAEVAASQSVPEMHQEVPPAAAPAPRAGSIPPARVHTLPEQPEQPEHPAIAVVPVIAAPAPGVAAATTIGPSMLRSLLGEAAQQRRALARPGHDADPSVPGSAPPPSTPAHVIAIVSPKGGVGKTTLCSALACSLARHGRVIVIDLDPQDALQYHLGVNATTAATTSATSAAAPSLPAGPDWSAAWHAGTGATRVVTHAVVARDGEADVNRQMALDSHWLGRRLQAMSLQADDVVLLDLPAGQSAYLDQALAAADQVVAVVTPDAGSFLALEHMRQVLHGRSNCRYVVNKYDGGRTFCQDMLEVLKRWMGPRLAGVVALDHAISEGLAYGFNPLMKEGSSPAYDQVQSISALLHAEHVRQAFAGGRA